MNTKRNIKMMLMLFCTLFVTLCVYLVYTITAYGTRWFTSPYNTRVSTRTNNIVAGRVLDKNGEVLAFTDEEGKRKYASDTDIRLSTSHVVGDHLGQTIGAQSLFAGHLMGFDQSAWDMIFYPNKTLYGSHVQLTIDAKLNKYLYQLMEGRSGAVVIINYKTGEILSSVSAPAFDPAHIEGYVKGESALSDGSLVNRVTMGQYTPGSTFKIVTLIAALRHIPNVTERTFACDGPLVFERESGKYIKGMTADQATDESKYVLLSDYQDERHGSVTLRQAFVSSCNTTFARLAMEIGANRLFNVAQELLVNKEFVFEEITLYTSSIKRANTDYALSWSGIGQDKNVMTPLHMCMISGAVANGGVIMAPRLLKAVTSPAGDTTYAFAASPYKTILGGSEAEIVKEYMLEVVRRGTGTRAKLSDYAVGGKTGTAEVSSDKDAGTHAWFTGFVDSDAHPYAICVILEKAGTGGSAAAPLAAQALSKAIELSGQS